MISTDTISTAAAPSVASANNHGLRERYQGRPRKAVHFDTKLDWNDIKDKAQKGHEFRERFKIPKPISKETMVQREKTSLAKLANGDNFEELKRLYSRGRNPANPEEHRLRGIIKEFFRAAGGPHRRNINIRLRWLQEEVGQPPNHNVEAFYGNLNLTAKDFLYLMDRRFENFPDLQPLPVVVSHGSSVGGALGDA